MPNDPRTAELLKPWPTSADLAELLKPVDLSDRLTDTDLAELLKPWP